MRRYTGLSPRYLSMRMRDETRNSRAIFLEALHAVEKLFPGKTLGTVIEAALVRRAGLSVSSARECGVRIQKIAHAAEGKSSGAYVRVSGTSMRAATDEFSALAEINDTYDIPALAGYARRSPREVYLDRGLKKLWKLRSGKTINVARYLILHEMVEKSLLDEFKFSKRGYQRCHQIAQRLEKEAVRADGLSWRAYQYGIMAREIDRAYAKRPATVPPDLDLTPYVDTNDTAALEAIAAARG